MIWEKIQNLYQQHYPHLPISVWHEHVKSCNLVKWNVLGTKLLSISLDGTAKIWSVTYNLTENTNNKLI